MEHILITKDNLLAFSSTQIDVWVNELITDKQIKITNSFTNKTNIFKLKDEDSNKHYTKYKHPIKFLSIYLITNKDDTVDYTDDDISPYNYVNKKLANQFNKT